MANRQATTTQFIQQIHAIVLNIILQNGGVTSTFFKLKT